jgi:hypothetical protein
VNRSIVVSLTLIAACTRAEPPLDTHKVEAEASAAAAQLKATLMTELTAALQRGGPLEALDVCAGRAQSLTEASATAHVRVGRTSHRLRNPKNRAPAWLQEAVDALARGERREATLTSIGQGRFGYFEPLVTQPMCTTCHGSDLPDELRAAIARRYPQDAALGFAPGDVRGLVWVEIAP